MSDFFVNIYRQPDGLALGGWTYSVGPLHENRDEAYEARLVAPCEYLATVGTTYFDHSDEAKDELVEQAQELKMGYE